MWSGSSPGCAMLAVVVIGGSVSRAITTQRRHRTPYRALPPAFLDLVFVFTSHHVHYTMPTCASRSWRGEEEGNDRCLRPITLLF